MVSMKLNQLIHDLKIRGNTVDEVQLYLLNHEREFQEKIPGIRTIEKYYNMPEVEINTNCSKQMAFDKAPFRAVIIDCIEGLPKKYCKSSVYDFLVEKYIDTGVYEKLPGNEQTLRNFIRHLEDTGVLKKDEGGRKYQYVFDSEPGDQALIDFGELKVNGCGVRVHFICVLLRYSRFLYVYAQDHKFNSEEACRAIYWSFCKFGGRPKQLVIDQDAVFVASEMYGEVIETATFREFLQEQELSLWTCRKADPEGKGPVENAVKFVKSNFFSGKIFESAEEVQNRLPGWMRRQNARIHKGICRVPSVMLEEIEKTALKPLIPSRFDESPLLYISVELGNKAFIGYRTCKYWISDQYCFQKVYYRVVNGKMIIQDENHVTIREHIISDVKGIDVIAEEDKRHNETDWILRADQLRARWNVASLEHLINGFKKECKNDTRVLARQLKAIQELFETYEPSIELVSSVVDECCERYRYKFTQFKEVFEQRWKETDVILFDDDGAVVEYTPVNNVPSRDMDSYENAFRARCSS